MNDTPNPFFKIDLSDGTTFSFRSPEELSTWIEKERAAFQWFLDGGAQAGAGVANLRQSFAGRFKTLNAHWRRWEGQLDNEGLREQFANAFRETFASNLSVRSDHEFARIASDIAAKHGPVAGSAALGFLLGIDSDISFPALKGVIEATLKKSGIDPRSPDFVAKTIADLNSSAAIDRAKSVGEWSGLTENARAFLQSTEKAFKAQVEEANQRLTTALEEMIEGAKTSIKSINDTESAYKERMNLQASVEYWGAKADRHRTAIWSSRLYLLLFTTLGGAGLVGALFWLATTAVELSEKTNAAAYLKFAAIGAIITTIAFWAGRVLLRIYLSDRHLLTDAEERVAMVKTYLALTNEGKLEPTDRALVLAPLFRSAADGIVKEEGPDASLAGIIAKALDARSVR